MTTHQQPGIVRLSCSAQNYAWGKIGNNSKVATLSASTPNFAIKEGKPYAEVGGLFIYFSFF